MGPKLALFLASGNKHPVNIPIPFPQSDTSTAISKNSLKF